MSVPITALILRCALIDNAKFISIVNGLTKPLEGRQMKGGRFLISFPKRKISFGCLSQLAFPRLGQRW